MQEATFVFILQEHTHEKTVISFRFKEIYLIKDTWQDWDSDGIQAVYAKKQSI